MRRNMMTLLLFFLLLSRPLTTSAKITTVIAFGDSTLDAGNNNGINTAVKANHVPYGQDFPGKTPTGRFSNGKLITDFLVSSLGIKDALPPYHSNLTVSDLKTGVSFASAGTGLDDGTAFMSDVINIESQLGSFKEYVARLKNATDEADRIVKDALFIVGVGSNDMMMNYYVNPITRSIYRNNVYSYQTFLLRRLSWFVQQIYSMGARNIAVSGLPPLGCLPLQMSLKAMSTSLSSSSRGPPPPRVCVQQQNSDAMAYNTQLTNMIKGGSSSSSSIQQLLPEAKVEYVDIYDPLMDMINYPLKYGFLETKRGCCGTGLLEMGPTCVVQGFVCPNPSNFIFWDSVHPSQAAYQALANVFTNTVMPQFTN